MAGRRHISPLHSALQVHPQLASVMAVVVANRSLCDVEASEVIGLPPVIILISRWEFPVETIQLFGVLPHFRKPSMCLAKSKLDDCSGHGDPLFDLVTKWEQVHC